MKRFLSSLDFSFFWLVCLFLWEEFFSSILFLFSTLIYCILWSSEDIKNVLSGTRFYRDVVIFFISAIGDPMKKCNQRVIKASCFQLFMISAFKTFQDENCTWSNEVAGESVRRRKIKEKIIIVKWSVKPHQVRSISICNTGMRFVYSYSCV